MITALPKGYSFIQANNQHVEISKSIIFGVLEEYGLIPDNPDLDNDLLWRAVVDRDASFDGKVFYGVLTTGIYCRPSCSSRRPKRGNTIYFFDQATAEKKGFRACKKCHPHKIDPRTIYPAELIAACKIFEDELEQDTGIQIVAAKIGVSDRTLRNLFDRRYATLGYMTLDQFGNDLPLYYPAQGRAFRAGRHILKRWHRYRRP